MQTEPFDLVETQRRIDALVAELRRASAAAGAAGQNIANATGSTSPYPYQGGAGRYAAGVSGYAGSNLSDACQGIAPLAAKVEEIKQKLLRVGDTLNNQLARWSNTYGQFYKGQQEIKEVARASDHLRHGQQIAHQERTRIIKLINIINNELNLAQRAFPVHLQPAGRQVGHSIDDIAGHGSDLYKMGPAINYRPPITQYVVPMLDKTRYGKLVLQPVTQYPSPRLRQDSSDGQETLWDKVTRGLGYFDRENLRISQVELPTYYYQMAPGSYTPASE